MKNATCAPPEITMNGSMLLVNGNKAEFVFITYWCHSPFILTGSQQRTCLPNGTWSGTVPLCETGILIYSLDFGLDNLEKKLGIKIFLCIFSSVCMKATQAQSCVHLHLNCFMATTDLQTQLKVQRQSHFSVKNPTYWLETIVVPASLMDPGVGDNQNV